MAKFRISSAPECEGMFRKDEATRLSSELNAVINDPTLTSEQRKARIREIAKKRSNLFLRRAAPHAA